MVREVENRAGAVPLGRRGGESPPERIVLLRPGELESVAIQPRRAAVASRGVPSLGYDPSPGGGRLATLPPILRPKA
jgi:hypothetical protein